MLISLTNSPGAAKHAGLFPAPVDAEFGSVYQLDFCLHDSGQRRSVALPLDRSQSPLMFHITDGSAITICRARWKWARKRIQIGPRGPGGPGGSCPPPQWSCRSSEWGRVQRSASSPRWPGNHLLLLKASRRGRHQLWANYIGSVRPVKNNLLREICRPAQTQTERWAGSGRVLMDALCELSLVFFHFLMSLSHNLDKTSNLKTSRSLSILLGSTVDVFWFRLKLFGSLRDETQGAISNSQKFHRRQNIRHINCWTSSAAYNDCSLCPF